MKELSAERRGLLAAVLSLLVIVAWSYFYKPKAPPTPPPGTASPAAGAQDTAPAPAAQPPASPATALAAAGPVTLGAVAATEERTVVIENDLYRIEISNRGAVVRSWQLKKYKDDRKPPRTLDVVHPEAAQQTGGWPLAVALDDAQLESRAQAALYEMRVTAAPIGNDAQAGPTSPGAAASAAAPAGGTLQPPISVQFEWSDGHLAVTKRLKFNRGYIVELQISAMLDGRPLPLGVAWLGGFGDTTVYMPAEQVQVFTSAGGKLQMLPYKKLGAPDQPAQRMRQPDAFDYAGLEDRYFAAAFLPGANPAQPRAAGPHGLTVWHWKLDRETQQDGKPAKEPVAEIAVGSTAAAPLDLRLFVGPKDLDELKKITPPLSDLVQFGWLDFIAAPLFYMLRWLHAYIPNYGWAIVLMTLIINMALFPLKVKSYRSMQKMQKVQPEVKAIQDRYKKYSLRDPRKQEMNKEVMAVYNREGINPMGGCLPMLLQMPIWFGLYRMLNVTIELRHAPWLGWVHDLSARDPYYILPVLMAVTMYVMQKMTPTTAADPAQQRMITLMPLMFGGMFIVFPVSSGLVLYILSSNLIGMGQQWYLNRTQPVDAKAPVKGRKK